MNPNNNTIVPGESEKGILPWSTSTLRGTVTARFGQVVEVHKDHTALILGEQRWSFRTLEHSSNQIAHGITRQFGLQQVPIAIFLRPGFSFFAAFLGILKSGNICLPLAPGQPLRRRQSILNSTGTAAVLSEESLLDRDLRNMPGIQIFEIDALLVDSPLTPVEKRMAPSDPAALYTTSGSTGMPKVVLRDHQNMLHHTMTYSLDQGISPNDRQSFLYSVQSGASMPDMLGALLNGATLLPYNINRYSIHELIS